MKCPNCTAMLPDGASFCPRCGVGLDPDFGPVAPPVTTAPTSGLAIASVLFGFLGLTCLPLLGSVVAVVTGHLARGEIDREGPGRLRGRGLATLGLVLGYPPTLLLLVLVVATLIVGVQPLPALRVGPGGVQVHVGDKPVIRAGPDGLELRQPGEGGVWVKPGGVRVEGPGGAGRVEVGPGGIGAGRGPEVPAPPEPPDPPAAPEALDPMPDPGGP